jgi:hypothetical protein
MGKQGSNKGREQAGGAHNKQPEQRKGKGWKGGGRKHTEHWQAEEKERKAKHTTKQNQPPARQLK